MLTERAPQSVLVVSGTAKGIQFLSDLLPASSYAPVTTVSNAGEARRMLSAVPYDLVIINAPLADEPGYDLAMYLADETLSCVLLIVKSELFDEICFRMEPHGVLTVAKPNARQVFYQAIKLLSAMRARLQKLEKKTANLQAKMDEIRVVNRAKWVLIEYLHMNEAQAHRYIEKQAMDMRLTRREVAESLIKTYES